MLISHYRWYSQAPSVPYITTLPIRPSILQRPPSRGLNLAHAQLRIEPHTRLRHKMRHINGEGCLFLDLLEHEKNSNKCNLEL